jgi:hypothetical protein
MFLRNCLPSEHNAVVKLDPHLMSCFLAMSCNAELKHDEYPAANNSSGFVEPSSVSVRTENTLADIKLRTTYVSLDSQASI